MKILKLTVLPEQEIVGIKRSDFKVNGHPL